MTLILFTLLSIQPATTDNNRIIIETPKPEPQYTLPIDRPRNWHVKLTA